MADAHPSLDASEGWDGKTRRTDESRKLKGASYVPEGRGDEEKRRRREKEKRRKGSQETEKAGTYARKHTGPDEISLCG